ncbi:MAG: M23 family metallopeptidase [Eubacteriales bacterium]|nr:M23 family metallopeptidase [Eubacteriales bacterium]
MCNVNIKKLIGGLVAGAILSLTVFVPAEARLDERITVEHKNQESAPSATALYRVKAGDNLWTIAERHRTDVQTLAEINGLGDGDFIREGQSLTLPGGAIGTQRHLVRDGENLSVIAERYRVSVSQLLRENSLTNPDFVRPGQELLIPVASTGGPVTPAGTEWRSLVWPTMGPMTSGFGIRDGNPHYGIDVAADHGQEIWAAAAGRAIHAGPAGTFGLLVILDHGGGFTTYYAHCSAVSVKVGERVDAGQQIAYIGSTGRSFGPHLHFETRWDGKPYDPLLYLSVGSGL